MGTEQITVIGLWDSWELSLLAKNRSAATIHNYRGHLNTFHRWLVAEGRPLGIDQIESSTVAAFIADQVQRLSPSTAATRFRCLRAFFNWVVDEEEGIEQNPMAKMSPPKLDQPEVPIFTDSELIGLLDACKGNSLAQRRDTAIVRVLLDTGLRAAETMGLAVDDIDLRAKTASVTGKGSRGRTVSFGNKTAQAIDRYLRRRAGHANADNSALWLGTRGPLGTSGLTQLLRRRGQQAGLTNVHPHRFRHTFSHRWLAAGGQEGDLQHLAGWASADMVRRYGASAKAERARDSHQRLALGDRL